MAKPTAQQCHAMTTYFMNEYAEKIGRHVSVNRNKARWGFEAILMDHSPSESRELVDYYLEHYTAPNLEWFLFNYEKVVTDKEDRAKREKAESARREETKKRLEEWRRRWEK